jgi:hypothetical protein
VESSKKLREVLRAALRRTAEASLQDGFITKYANGDAFGQLPKGTRDTLTSFVRETILAVGVDLTLDEVGPYLDNLQEGFDRIGKLVDASIEFSDTAGGDTLRASVVLLHASLEDFVRTLSERLLPTADEVALNQIPLLGQESRAEKFFLGKLVHHRGKTVDDLLRESVCKYLERSNYNNTEDIARTLEQLGFAVADHSDMFPLLEQLMKRRHQIVHRADKIKVADSDAYIVQAIERADVHKWSVAVFAFVGGILPSLAQRLFTREKLESAVRAVAARQAQNANTSKPPDSQDGANPKK